ncbi:hypothetical protein [Bacilliculturomica massiliensis]|uniref:hypothetical protein n=1 Tax=Bacilliculturomica massiliensis TaxID=1917867 RepID=UPI0010302220|nr:hypothetical protein [Bacilliculturomica massiliensis]
MLYRNHDLLPDDGEDRETEDLRRRLISQLEAAYFGGVGPAAAELAEVRDAERDRLLEIAGRWGVK